MIDKAYANQTNKLVGKTAGFTIIELLIVIVVIGILAAITVVSYNGIQDRAYITKAASVVDSYVKLFEMYKVDHGYYPFEGASPGYDACLGNISNFPAGSGFETGQCWTSSVSGAEPITAKDSLNNLLLPYAATLPSGNLPVVRITLGDQWVSMQGAYYATNFANRPEGPAVPGIAFQVKGDQDCPRGEKASYSQEDFGMDMTSCLVYLGDPN